MRAQFLLPLAPKARMMRCAGRHRHGPRIRKTNLLDRMTDSSRSDSRAHVRHMDALPVGTRLAEFEILALLGVGGFGMVYKAFDHSLHRAVAIKEYMPATLATRAADGALWARSSTDEPAFQAGLHSFVDEARMLAQFDHPSLVKVFRFWEAQNTAYMVMPLYHGMTFKQARAQMRTPPPEAWLRQVLWSVLEALRVLHGANALHRDISPDNIFLQDVGPPVLLDLGASRHAINDRDRKHTAVLKVNYAPIEQYSDGDGEGNVELEQGPWTDLYSLGAVVHGCLCNDTPLPATLRALRDRMVPFARVAKTVRKQFGQEYSAPFVDAIGQALKLQPEDRPQNIDAFLALMDMASPPPGLDHFDFRAELGSIWVEPTDQPDPTVAITTVNLSGQHGPDSVPLALAAAKTSVPAPPRAPAPSAARAAAVPPPEAAATDAHMDTIFLEPGSSQMPDSLQPDGPGLPGGATASVAPTLLESQWTPARPAPRKRRPWLLPLCAAALVLVLGAATLGMRHMAAPAARASAPADANIITELKEEPLAVPPAAAPDVPAAVATASEPVADLGPPPAFVPAGDARSVAARPAPRPARAAPVEASPAIPEAPTVVTFPSPEPPPPSPPAPAPRRAAPAAVCANTNMLTRSMCLREQCSHPDNTRQAACVEFRRAMEPLERNHFAN